MAGKKPKNKRQNSKAEEKPPQRKPPKPRSKNNPPSTRQNSKAKKKPPQTKASKPRSKKSPTIPVVRNEPTADESFEMEEAVTSDTENDPIVTEEDDKKRWKKGELFAVGAAIRFVKSQQAAKTGLSRKLKKWREAQKALFARKYKRSKRAIYQKWTRLTNDWRAMFDRSLGNTASGGSRKGVDYRFLADYQEYISPLTEATKPSFVMETRKRGVFVVPLKMNCTTAVGQKQNDDEGRNLKIRRDVEDEYEDYDEGLESEAGDGNVNTQVEEPGRSMDDELDVRESEEINIDLEEVEDEMGNQSMAESNRDINTQNFGKRTGNGDNVTTVLIDSPSPNRDVGETVVKDLYRLSRNRPKIKSKKTGVKTKLLKGQMMAVRCDQIYEPTDAPALRPDEFVPVVITGTHRNNLYDVSTLDLEAVPTVNKKQFQGQVENPQDFVPNDCMEQKMEYLETVYLREGSEEDHPDITRLGPQMARYVKYYVLGGFKGGAIIGRKPPGKESGNQFKTVLRRKSGEIIACRNRIPVRMTMPSNIEIRPRNYSVDELDNMKAKLARTKQAETNKLKFGEGFEIGDKVYFCVVDALLEEVGPLVMGNDGSKVTLNDLPERGPTIRPGDQTTHGADAIELHRGDSLIFLRDGNVEDFGTCINVVRDHVLIQSHREGTCPRYENVLNVQCRQMNKVVTANYQELKDAKRNRREEDQEPIFVHPRPTLIFATGTDDEPQQEDHRRRKPNSDPERSMDNENEGDETGETAGERIDKLLDEILKRGGKSDTKEKDAPKEPGKDKKGNKKRGKKADPESEDEDPDVKRSKMVAKEVAAVLLPGFADIFSGYWRDKRNYATKTHNAAQLHATTQIQTAMQFVMESRRAEMARQERLLVELMRMAGKRQDGMMRILNLMSQTLGANIGSEPKTSAKANNGKERTRSETAHLEDFLGQLNNGAVPEEGNETEPQRSMDYADGPPEQRKDPNRSDQNGT